MKPSEYLDLMFAGDKPRRCWVCSALLSRGTASVDHLQPKSKGGLDRRDNYRLACKPCNGARGNQTISKVLRRELQGRPLPKQRDYTALVSAIRKQNET